MMNIKQILKEIIFIQNNIFNSNEKEKNYVNNEDKNKEDNIVPNYNNQVQYFINTSYDNNEGNNRINKKVYDYNLYYPSDNKTNGNNYNNSDNKPYDNSKYNVVINDNNNIVNDNKNNLYE